MITDDDLIDVVGIDNVINICNRLGCGIIDVCLTRDGDSKLCGECLAEVLSLAHPRSEDA